MMKTDKQMDKKTDKRNMNKTESKKKKTPKQIAALICVALLVLLYVATLIVACLDFPGSDQMFAACLIATIGLPILFWIFIWVYGNYTQKKTIATIFPEDLDDTSK